MTQLRKRMVEELQRRNYSQSTIESYLHAVEDFARHFGKSPDQLNQEHIRQYHLHRVNHRKLAVNTIVARIAALRFFSVKTLRRPYQREDLPSPRRPKKIPTVLSQKEVARLIDSAGNIFHVVFTDGRDHPKDLEPTWFGHSIGKWEGDTLMVDTVGFSDKTRVDTEGHPHTEALHVVEHFRRTDTTHMAYDVTITDSAGAERH